ncbi:MAG: hypothetical protein RLY67_449 [Pseudomonadota bacterium]
MDQTRTTLPPATLNGLKRPLTARLVLGMLERLQVGQLRLVGPEGEFFFQGEKRAGLGAACLRIHDWSVFERAIKRGDIGFGEAFMEGLWSSPDLACLLKTLAANRQVIEKAILGNRWLLVLDRLAHLFRRNTIRQAKRNIEAHYDLGNDFYRIWLDATMTYSSALYTDAELTGQTSSDLEAAQYRKMDRALEMLGPLDESSQTLEIGCGWGALAQRRLSQMPGAHLGITLSTEQQAWAINALNEAGLTGRAEIRLQDYRVCQGQFDGIISIEMIEAVGESYWPTYFETLQRCLKPGKRAVIQAILIRDDLFDRYRSGHDFIQKYIFPGGMLLSTKAIREASHAAGLVIQDEFYFGHHYGKTLHDWLETFNQHEQEIRALGYDDRFLAMWRFYLAYCEAGFFSGDLEVVQVCLQRPN